MAIGYFFLGVSHNGHSIHLRTDPPNDRNEHRCPPIPICSMPIHEPLSEPQTVCPAVVHIRANRTSHAQDSTSRDGGGSGSGFIISADGLIVTNSHVVHDANDLRISLHEGRQISTLSLLVTIPIRIWLFCEFVVPSFRPSSSPTRRISALANSRSRSAILLASKRA